MTPSLCRPTRCSSPSVITGVARPGHGACLPRVRPPPRRLRHRLRRRPPGAWTAQGRHHHASRSPSAASARPAPLRHRGRGNAPRRPIPPTPPSSPSRRRPADTIEAMEDAADPRLVPPPPRRAVLVPGAHSKPPMPASEPPLTMGDRRRISLTVNGKKYTSRRCPRPLAPSGRHPAPGTRPHRHPSRLRTRRLRRLHRADQRPLDALLPDARACRPMAPTSSPSKASQPSATARPAACTRCRKPSANTMACNAASAPPAC